MTDAKKQESKWEKYLDNLMSLAEKDCQGNFKQVLKLRLRGDHKTAIDGIVSPNLTRDEYEENQLVVYAYKSLREVENTEAVLCLRTVVTELLIEALKKKDDLKYIDELGYLMASVEMEESPELVEKLSSSMWSQLQQLNFKQLILSEGTELEYISRVFDVWLTVATSPDHKDQLEQLFKDSVGYIANNNSVSQIQFRFLSLMFRALIKFSPHFAGKVAFYELHKSVLREKNPKYIRSFNNLCWELGILIRGTAERQKQFINGLNAAARSLRNEALKSLLCIDALNRMKLVFSPSDEIGFVLTVNKIAGEIILEQQNMEEQSVGVNKSPNWQKALEELNQEGSIISLAEIFHSKLTEIFLDEEFRTKASIVFLNKKLRQFVKAALGTEWWMLKRNNNTVFSHSVQSHFKQYLGQFLDQYLGRCFLAIKHEITWEVSNISKLSGKPLVELPRNKVNEKYLREHGLIRKSISSGTSPYCSKTLCLTVTEQSYQILSFKDFSSNGKRLESLHRAA